MYIEYCYGPKWPYLIYIAYIGLFGTGICRFVQVLYLGSAANARGRRQAAGTGRAGRADEQARAAGVGARSAGRGRAGRAAWAWPGALAGPVGGSCSQFGF